MTIKEVVRYLKGGDKVTITNCGHYKVGLNPNTLNRFVWEFYNDDGCNGEYAILNALYMEQYGEINHLCIHRLHYMENIVETFKLDLTQSDLAEIECKYSARNSTMTLFEIERQLNEGDSIILTSGEHYRVCVNPIRINFEIYDDELLMERLTEIYAIYHNLDNIYIHRLHFDRFIVETFKLELSSDELAEIQSRVR
jgi:hypothetical protein